MLHPYGNTFDMMVLMLKNSKKGFTLIETIVSMAVLMLFFTAVAWIMKMTLETVAYNRIKGIASGIAQEQLETARNLSYENLGTIGGIPAGSLNQNEDIIRNGQVYKMNTSVVFVDDEFDNKAPSDPVPTDYKRVRVSIEWDGAFPSRLPLVMITDIAPAGIENNANTGTISILVFNSSGEPVSNAEVRIVSSGVSPSVNMLTLSDSYGRVMLPGAKTCRDCYSIVVTKAGNSEDKTYSSTEVTNPN